MAFFSKDNNGGELNLLDLHTGSQFEYDSKIWTISNITDCDWGDSESKEYEIEANGEKAFLEAGLDESELSMTVTKTIKVNMIDGDIEGYIHQNDSAPQEISMNGYQFYLTDDYGGFCSNRSTGEKDEVYIWEYYDESENFVLSIEQWGENEFEASFGTIVHEHEITDPHNSGGGGRFS